MLALKSRRETKIISNQPFMNAMRTRALLLWEKITNRGGDNRAKLLVKVSKQNKRFIFYIETVQ